MRAMKHTCKEIVDDLAHEIVGKGLASGVRLGTSQELLRRYCVSQRTMERALSELCHRGLIQRIPGKGTFVRSSVPISRKCRIGVVVWNFDSLLNVPPFYQVVIGSFERRLHDILVGSGYSPEFCSANGICNDISDLRALVQRLEGKFDCVIIPGGFIEFASDIMLKSKTTFLLYTDDVVHPGPWHQVVFDYRPGFGKAIGLFRRLGVKKIIVVGMAESTTSKHRMELFHQEALTSGYSSDDVLLHYEKNHILSPLLSGQNFAHTYLERHWEDYGIFSTSDFLALGMMSEFKKLGVKAGRDFQLVSYDNFEGQMSSPDFRFGVTGITHPQHAVPGILAAMLEDLGRQRQGIRMYRTYWIPADELVVRQTTRRMYHA